MPASTRSASKPRARSRSGSRRSPSSTPKRAPSRPRAPVEGVLAPLLRRLPGDGVADKATVMWFIIDGVTHLTIELLYLYYAVLSPVTAQEDTTALSFMWREYGKADRRWMVRDGGIIALEMLTVLVMGPACLFAAYGTAKRAPWRHALQLAVCVSELYGGWMTFAPEWFTGSPNLDTSYWVYTYVYLLWMNGVWVYIPILLAWESGTVLTAAMGGKARRGSSNGSAIGDHWFVSIIVVVLVYGVSVPAVLVASPNGWI